MRFSLLARRLHRWRWGIPLTCVLTAGVVAIPTLALAGHGSSNVTDYTGCLNRAGKISRFAVGTAPTSPCSKSQTEIHISGGDITNVATPASGGLQGGTANGEASVELQQSYKLPQTCSDGEVAKWNGSAWTCATDDNSTYDGTDFATSGQSCSSGRMVTGIDVNGALVCSNPGAQSLDVVKVDAAEQVPFNQGRVAEAKCPDGYKLVGGGWGTRGSISDGADVYDWGGSPETYDVGAGGVDPFGGRVYARAYCIRLN